MLFLGTGAAELYPNPFCGCETCNAARERGETRKRSVLRVDERTCIDFGPDVLAASQQYNAPLTHLEHLFITHTHEDHLSFDNLGVLTMTKPRPVQALHVYLSEAGKQWVEDYMAAVDGLYHGHFPLAHLVREGAVVLHGVKAGTPFSVAGMEVFAVHSDHPAFGQGEYALNYRITRPEGTLLYACDTGLYSEETCRALAGVPLDDLVMESTLGGLDVPRDSHHLSAAHFIENIEALRRHGAVTEKTRIYATHINQVQPLGHEELQRFFDERSPLQVIVARDGMETGEG